MKNILMFVIITIIVFFSGSLFLFSIISKLLNGYQTVEGSFHLLTHSELIMLTIIISFYAKLIINRINKLKDN